jgi:hypothetical protein
MFRQNSLLLTALILGGCHRVLPFDSHGAPQSDRRAGAESGPAVADLATTASDARRDHPAEVGSADASNDAAPLGWTVIKLQGGKDNLYGVWGRSLAEVFVVGAGPTILCRNSTPEWSAT